MRLTTVFGMKEMTDPIDTAATRRPEPDIDAVLDRVEQCVTEISLGFDRWDDARARGPGLYFLVERPATGTFATPMGASRWPIEDCASVLGEPEAFLEVARTVAFSRDGAVVVHSDGTIEETMVRVKQLSPGEGRGAEELPFAGWMGARHMSALEASTREEVAAAITLSEEDGRVTVFTDGTFEDVRATSLVVD